VASKPKVNPLGFYQRRREEKRREEKRREEKRREEKRREEKRRAAESLGNLPRDSRISSSREKRFEEKRLGHREIQNKNQGDLSGSLARKCAIIRNL